MDLHKLLVTEPDKLKTTYVDKPIKTIEYSINTIMEKIDSIDSLNDNEIKNIILRQHSMILNYDIFLKDDESRRIAQKMFTNKRFLKIFLDISGLIPLSYHEIICINKLAYDYYVIGIEDKEVSSLLLQICAGFNNQTVIRLSGKLGMNGARILSMISKSSFKDDKNVHRVNTFLIKCNLELSVQDIIDIYCIIFTRFSYPFIYSMLEVKRQDITLEMSARFDMISQALLAILDSLTSSDMEIVLYNYAYMIKIHNVQAVRFSLKSAKEFPRLQSVISKIEHENDFENLIIP